MNDMFNQIIKEANQIVKAKKAAEKLINEPVSLGDARAFSKLVDEETIDNLIKPETKNRLCVGCGEELYPHEHRTCGDCNG